MMKIKLKMKIARKKLKKNGEAKKSPQSGVIRTDSFENMFSNKILELNSMKKQPLTTIEENEDDEDGKIVKKSMSRRKKFAKTKLYRKDSSDDEDNDKNDGGSLLDNTFNISSISESYSKKKNLSYTINNYGGTLTSSEEESVDDKIHLSRDPTPPKDILLTPNKNYPETSPNRKNEEFEKEYKKNLIEIDTKLKNFQKNIIKRKDLEKEKIKLLKEKEEKSRNYKHISMELKHIEISRITKKT